MTLPKSVGGRYELGELLGYGGMAEVHKGRDVRLGRDVAVKVLRADLARDPSFQNRFRREAQAAAGLNHPAIVSVYDTGEDHITSPTEDIVSPYIVMEFVEGRTLREVLKAEGQLPIGRAMEITAEICSALDFSHRSGIVHRDVKPGNVMITKTGAVKVMDFGIARALADNAATVTATAAVIGTAQYLSPEQARGESVDARSDVYSTGCLLYELVTGHPPFTGDSPVAVAYQHVRENPRIPSSVNSTVPRELDSIIMKALAKNPLNRYQTAAEMRTDLQRAIGGQRVEAEAVMTDAERTQLISKSAAEPPRSVGRPAILQTEDEPEDERRSHRGAILWALVVVLLLAAIAGTGYFVLRKDNTSSGPQALSSIIGQDPTAATNNLRDAGFIPPANPAKSNGPCTQPVQVGQVCTQSPPAGTMLKKGQPVSFTVYAGLANVTVPQVTSLPYSTALQMLSQAGLTAVPVQTHSTETANTVLDQSPEAGQSVQPASSVTLKISDHKIVLRGGLVGRDQANASAGLNSDGWLNVKYVQVPIKPGFIAGQVMSVTPTPGFAYDIGTEIDLSIATAPTLPACPTTSAPAASGATTSPAGATTSPAGTTPSGSTTPSSSTSAGAAASCTP